MQRDIISHANMRTSAISEQYKRYNGIAMYLHNHTIIIVVSFYMPQEAVQC